MIDTDELRRAFAQSFSGRASTACPEPAELWDTIEARLPAERRRAIVDHIAECSRCAESWRIAVHMGATSSRWKKILRRLSYRLLPPWVTGRPAVIVALGTGMVLGGCLSLFTGRPLAATALCLAGLWVRERWLRSCK